MKWRVVITEEAKRQLARIKDQRVQAHLRDAIQGLAENPEQQGKPMISELKGYRSLRAVGQRYRILYRTEADVVTVFVVLVGIRRDGDARDVYALAKKLLNQGLVERPQPAQVSPEQHVPPSPNPAPPKRGTSRRKRA